MKVVTHRAVARAGLARLAGEDQEAGGVVRRRPRCRRPGSAGRRSRRRGARRWRAVSGRRRRRCRRRRPRCRRRPPAEPCRRRKSRHWPSAWTWLSTARMPSRVAPGTARSWWFTRRKCSPMMCRPPCGIRWCTSATRPATVLSTGIMASLAPALAHRGERVLERVAGPGRELGKALAAGEVRVGAGLPWKAMMRSAGASGQSLVLAAHARPPGCGAPSRGRPACRRRTAPRRPGARRCSSRPRGRAAAPAARAAPAGSAAGRRTAPGSSRVKA